ncbi:MAG: cyclic peptide export ABC transporter, partial [Algicola sp.]|nr:cyclic peptide export ABC transporter [Algicola sp.]
MKITKQLLGEAKSGMILAMLASAVSAAAGIAIIAGINSALDGGITNPNSSLAIYAALLIALMISSICSQAMMVKIGYAMVYRMRKMLVNQLLNTPIERQEQIGAPLIYNVLNRDVNMVANATRELPVVVYNSLLVVAGFGYLYWLSPLLFGFVTVVAVLGVWSNAKLSNKLGVMLGKVRRLDDRLFGQYEAAVEGRNELALNPNRRHFLVDQQFDPTAQESRK